MAEVLALTSTILALQRLESSLHVCLRGDSCWESPSCVPDTTVTSACGQMPTPASESSCCCSPILLSHTAMQNAWGYQRLGEFECMRENAQIHIGLAHVHRGTHVEKACNDYTKCYSHLISSVCMDTHRQRDFYSWKYTPADLVSAPSVCVCVCACLYVYIGRAEPRVESNSKAQQDFPIKSSRKTERLIKAYCMFSAESCAKEKLLQRGGHAAACFFFFHNEIFKRLKLTDMLSCH